MRLCRSPWAASVWLGLALWTLSAAFAQDGMPGLVDVTEQPRVDAAGGANQGAFPYYYNAGVPSEDDLVRFDTSPADGEPSVPPDVFDALAPHQGAFPDYYNPALLLQSKAALEAEIHRSRAAFNLVQSFCESGETNQAWEVYVTMPAFADNTVINDYRTEAASLLVLNLCRDNELPRAREIYDALPDDIPGDAAMLARARTVINLTTYYVMAEAYADAFDILMDIADNPERNELAPELFRLMARMVPYLDSAGESDKAYAVYRLLLEQVRNQETARLFADNFPSIPRYYLQAVKIGESAEWRERRLELLQRIFDSLVPVENYPEIALSRMTLAGSLVEYYTETGQRDKAKHYYDIMHEADKTPLLGN